MWLRFLIKAQSDQAINSYVERLPHGLTGKLKAAATRKIKRLQMSQDNWTFLERMQSVLEVRKVCPKPINAYSRHWQVYHKATLDLSTSTSPTICMILPLYKTILDTLDKKMLELEEEADSNLDPLYRGLQAGKAKLLVHFNKAFESHYILLGAGALSPLMNCY